MAVSLVFFHCAIRLFIHAALPPALVGPRNATFGTGGWYVLSTLAHHHAISRVWSVGDICGCSKRAIAIDSSQNCFPSLHAALTLLAVWAIAKKDNRWLTLMSVVWAIAIAFSILQLRRHLFIDLVGGALLASGCGWIAARLDMRNKQERKTNHE
ncbi:phosphatase PAP2 family protein [Escherichia albertii]|uniref:phosphatase PAP2 family protein n=1 Tax=Escherichia albertii TaxID=208962 RepID=UPI00223B3B97|nr:phosphatase PAP2 family protein [Escherichia albertii]MCZ9165655.1 phosphatase PAP2 family protein [Escherichia albertii]